MHLCRRTTASSPSPSRIGRLQRGSKNDNPFDPVTGLGRRRRHRRVRPRPSPQPRHPSPSLILAEITGANHSRPASAASTKPASWS